MTIKRLIAAASMFATFAAGLLPAEGQGSIETDRAALVALYDATDGDNWNDNDGWKTDRPLGEWYGVWTGLNYNDRVTELNLRRNNLTGSIPRELGNLTNLEDLNLRGNNLTGSIPRELGNLTNLEQMHILDNTLTGSIPRELGNLRNLEVLRINMNNLTGEIPRELENLQNLEILGLNTNNLTGPIPREIGNMTSLEWISFGMNNLTGEIPRELGNMANLKRLSLHTNGLTGQIPRELGSLTNLSGLWLAGNHLTGEIPRELGRLTNLSSLELNSNRLTGEIPRELASFEGTINPQQNGVILPIEGDTVDSVDRAVLGAFYDATGGANWNNNTNWKTDRPLSEWHGVRTDDDGRVIDLVLRVNNLSGAIPRELGSLTNLRFLALSSNPNLSGSIPSELGSLTNLVNLSLTSNNLSGEIPRELSNPTNLSHLALSGNNLSGSIPRELGSLTNLVNLFLGINNLTGEIPRELGNLTNLETLVIARNNLSGEIPRELGGLTNLESLDVRENNLTGAIPRELARFADTINPQQNGVILPIEGDTVDSAADKTVLEAFYDATGGANWNNNEGWKTDRPLSEWRGVTTRVEAGVARVTGLSLPNNNLTGEFPSRLADLAPNLETLVLNGNNLTGAIPEALRRFENTINPQAGGVNLPVGTPVPALPTAAALLLAAGLWFVGRRRMAR